MLVGARQKSYPTPVEPHEARQRVARHRRYRRGPDAAIVDGNISGFVMKERVVDPRSLPSPDPRYGRDRSRSNRRTAVRSTAHFSSIAKNAPSMVCLRSRLSWSVPTKSRSMRSPRAAQRAGSARAVRRASLPPRQRSIRPLRAAFEPHERPSGQEAAIAAPQPPGRYLSASGRANLSTKA